MRTTGRGLATVVWLAVGAWGCSSDSSHNDLNDMRRPPPQRSTPDDAQAPNDDGKGSDGSVAFETPGEPRIDTFGYWQTPEGHVPTYFAHLMGSGWVGNLFLVRISNPNQAARTVAAYASVDGFTKTQGSKLVELAPGETKEILFGPQLDLEKIGTASGTTSTKLSLSLYTTNGDRLFEIASAVDVLPKGRVFDPVFGDDADAPKGQRDRTVAGMVMTTPQDRWGEVAKLVQEVATYTAGHSLPSYKDCKSRTTFDDKRACYLGQFKAVYEVLKTRGMAVTALPSDFFSAGREVRYPAETLRANAGSSFEVALVVISALEAMGLDAGYNTMANAMLPVIDVRLSGSEQEELYGIDPALLPTGSFDDALKAAATAATAAYEQKDPWYDYLATATARSQGITPAPFPY